MKQIEAFVDSVYQGVGGNEKEIQELKEEMNGHLLEAVHDLKSEGKTEQEAIELAIERFGGEQEMRSIVSQLFKAQKVFAKWVLYLAIAFLVISSTVFGVMWVAGEQNSHENSIVATKIFNLLHNKDNVSEDMKKEIETLVKGTDQISKVQINNVQDVKLEAKSYNSIFEYVENAKPNYQFERKIWAPDWAFDLYPYGNGDSEWYVNMEVRYIDTIMTLVLFVGVAVYAALFTIWATINAYHQRRLNVGWVLVFAFLNVIGYLVYIVIGKRVQSKTIL
ncbi:permease prefix domain 1-containing protein [Bacillus salipaludis]|uniref:Permease prefix domain 1-containing protein n=1 Tax=Bacillus salipaludis TaxID=2547811 RepID=A0AA90QWQ8_9BACI|nr:permease prefix domain 1-containing protein [Bacillus salipaludis]MDQ6596452.1 permease prefix domain 1-containing protein [Bacillus salipaludis]